MKLIKIESQEKGIWYFTTAYKAAKYIGCSYQTLYMQLKGITKQTYGWKVEEIESDTIICKYINPEK